MSIKLCGNSADFPWLSKEKLHWKQMDLLAWW